MIGFTAAPIEAKYPCPAHQGGSSIFRWFNSREGVIAVSLGLTVCGIVFILLTGRYELSFFVAAALLPWVEYWSRRNRR